MLLHDQEALNLSEVGNFGFCQRADFIFGKNFPHFGWVRNFLGLVGCHHVVVDLDRW